MATACIVYRSRAGMAGFGTCSSRDLWFIHHLSILPACQCIRSPSKLSQRKICASRIIVRIFGLTYHEGHEMPPRYDVASETRDEMDNDFLLWGHKGRQSTCRYQEKLHRRAGQGREKARAGSPFSRPHG